MGELYFLVFYPSKGAFSAGFRRFGGFIIQELFKNGVDMKIFNQHLPDQCRHRFQTLNGRMVLHLFLGGLRSFA